MRKLYISFGHQGKGTGASALTDSIRRDESLMAIELVTDLKAALAEYPHVKHKDSCTSLTRTIQIANKWCGKDGLAVDIHFNAGGGSGVEAVVAERCSAKSLATAEKLAEVVSNTLGIKKRGERGVKRDTQTRHKRLGWCRDINSPSVLLEIAFVDSSEDMKAYVANYDKLVAALAGALIECTDDGRNH